MQPMVAGDLHTQYQLPPSAVEDFDRDGFVKLPGVLERSTLQALQPDISEKVFELNTTTEVPEEERDTLQKAFLQVGNLWRYSQGARDLVFSHRLAGIAQRLMGVDGVRFYAEQALYKEPSGEITPWHTDQYYWPLASDRVCTVWIPLQDTPLDMGPLEFARGSHRFQHGRDLAISPESERLLHERLAQEQFETVSTPFDLGDVSFHLGWTFHRAGRNVSDKPRRVLTIVYLDAAARVSDEVGEHEQAQLDILMPGTKPGEIPNGAANPMLYPM